ncbi:RIB43A-like with coiled-coils protein 2 [Rhodnius prolixus]|uniref:Uncharacterized protein n=1 Tax=Rhodnius prolixus TaxID=13249 RepID=T1HJW0_RHOPR
MFLNFDKIIPRTKSEIKQQQKLERIRHCENLRKERFFNAKNRLMGSDKEGLLKQIDEKKERKKLEDEQEEVYFKKIVADVDLGNALQHRNENLKKELAREVDVYRLTQQQKHKSREFDLNDPKRITNQLPMRFEGIIDPREMTMGSFLKFSSEDYDGEKAKTLKKHLWQCLAKQISENLISKNNHKITHLQTGQEVMKEDGLVNKAMKYEEAMRLEAAKSNMEYNLRKADYEREKRRLEKQQGAEDELAHINTVINSDIFTENPEASKSSLGKSRMISYNFRGLTEEEKLEIREIQKKQIEEMEMRKNVDRATEKYWKEVIELQTNVKTAAELLDTQKKKELNRKVLEENMKLAAEQAIQKECMKKVATDNFPTNEYFDCFNTTAR